MNEADFVAALRALADRPEARGLADDAAVLDFGGETLVVTHDTLVEGVHVLPGQDPADIAWKLVAVNLSDLAAKGARPLGVLLGHMLGEGDDRFIAGLEEVLAAFATSLLGGDTVRAEGRRAWSCTAIGRAVHTPVPDRRAARAGDEIFVTGTLGRAMLAFEALRDGVSLDAAPYLRPQPRLAEGLALAPHVHAMMDVSDGLLLDAWRMAAASGTSAIIETAAVPVADAARRDACLRWGDDYELLFTAAPGMALPVPASRIGRIGPRGESPLALGGEFVPTPEGLGYTH